MSGGKKLNADDLLVGMRRVEGTKELLLLVEAADLLVLANHNQALISLERAGYPNLRLNLILCEERSEFISLLQIAQQESSRNNDKTNLN